jgi:hypothetical protein
MVAGLPQRRKGTRNDAQTRQLLAGLAVAILAVATGIVATHLTGTEAPTERERGEGVLPIALDRHLERLRQAVPGNAGMSPEGPGSAADATFLERAYPGNTISIRQVDSAKTSYDKANRRPFPTGKGKNGVWSNVGPSKAVYPFTEFRNAYNYVPNEYVAGGRTTSIAISHRCTPGDCLAWITPAGGGIWRSYDILAAQPKWRYLGGPLGINAAGNGAIDRNDATGRTIYVGTGEANTCASGCVAAVGLYKSTNGGDTWVGPLGKAEPGGKGIGEIMIKTGDPKTLYVGRTTALRGLSSVCCSGITRPVPDAAKWGLYKSTDGGATWGFIHNGSTNAAECTGSADEFANRTTCSRSACATSRSIRPTRTSSMPRRTRGASGARRTAALPGPRSSPRSTPRSSRPARRST